MTRLEVFTPPKLRSEPTLVHARPVHVINSASPFSKDSDDQNYRGFLHLAMLLLVVNMLRLVVENFQKYGVLLSIPGRNVPFSDFLYCFFAVMTLWVNITVSYVLERTVVSTPWLGGSKLYTGVIIANVTALLLIPAFIVWTHMYHPLIGSFAMSLSIILCMKIISYHVVNAELRQRWKERIGEDPYPDCPYPKNITLRNVAYFWVAPTLCYQPTYPLIEAFRPKFFIKRLVELGAALAMMHILTDQYAIPTVKNSMKPINELNLMGMVERLLKLSISSLYIWLLAFYALFHSFLNAFAELVRFGDRMFYKSWWNAKSFEEYWRLWNAPVHQWLKRHIYFPMRARGWSSSTSQVSIFVISAMAHELLVGVPTHVLEGWAFFAMIFQIPLVAATGWFTRLKPNSSAGNFFFWICFCIVGQPMIVLLYYRSWINRIL